MHTYLFSSFWILQGTGQDRIPILFQRLFGEAMFSCLISKNFKGLFKLQCIPMIYYLEEGTWRHLGHLYLLPPLKIPLSKLTWPNSPHFWRVSLDKLCKLKLLEIACLWCSPKDFCPTDAFQCPFSVDMPAFGLPTWRKLLANLLLKIIIIKTNRTWMPMYFFFLVFKLKIWMRTVFIGFLKKRKILPLETKMTEKNYSTPCYA